MINLSFVGVLGKNFRHIINFQNDIGIIFHSFYFCSFFSFFSSLTLGEEINEEDGQVMELKIYN